MSGLVSLGRICLIVAGLEVLGEIGGLYPVLLPALVSQHGARGVSLARPSVLISVYTGRTGTAWPVSPERMRIL